MTLEPAFATEAAIHGIMPFCEECTAEAQGRIASER